MLLPLWSPTLSVVNEGVQVGTKLLFGVPFEEQTLLLSVRVMFAVGAMPCSTDCVAKEQVFMLGACKTVNVPQLIDDKLLTLFPLHVKAVGVGVYMPTTKLSVAGKLYPGTLDQVTAGVPLGEQVITGSLGFGWPENMVPAPAQAQVAV
jgi:hypothetical protein